MRRPALIVMLLAFIGVVLSGLVAARVYSREVLIESAFLARGIESHARLVQERLSERELLTRVAVGLIRASSPLEPNALKPLRSSIYAFKADFVLAGWIAQLKPSDIARAQSVLAESGFGPAAIRNFDDSPLPVLPPDIDLNILMDVEPQTAGLPGRVLNFEPNLAPVLKAAQESRAPAVSDPMALPRTNDSIGLVLAAPAFEDDATSPLGFVTFSFRIGPLMLANEAASPFRVVLCDPRDSSRELSTDNVGRVVPSSMGDGARSLRTVSFGGRDWKLGYYAKADPTDRAFSLAIWTLAGGMLLSGMICGLFGYVAASNSRLRREMDVRTSFEGRLGAVIGELNHRVKNILAVTQSIVTRTLRPGGDIEEARELLIGRIHAMSHVVSLLSDSYWQGVKLRSLLETRAVPHHEQIVATGPDVIVSARSAQSLSLVFFELASHADSRLAGNQPLNIIVQWHVTGEEPDEVFHLRWEEFNTRAETRRRDNDFGISLLDRVAPEALGGTARRYFTDVSYVYELTAPMKTVLDKTEIQRTGKWANPASA